MLKEHITGLSPSSHTAALARRSTRAVYTQIRRIREWLAHRIGTAAALVRRLPTPGSVRLIWEAGDYPLGEVAGGQGGALASTPLGGTAGERNLPGGAFVDVR